MSDEELLLQKFALGENGAELRLHNEFCEQLIKFGINATYVQGFKESFDFEKVMRCGYVLVMLCLLHLSNSDNHPTHHVNDLSTMN